MKNQATFTSWDFVNTWGLFKRYNSGYSVLLEVMPNIDPSDLSDVILNPIIPPEVPRINKSLKYTPIKRRR